MIEKLPQKLILKNSTIRIDEVIIILAIISGIFYSLNKQVGFSAIVLAVGLIFMLGKMYKRISDKKPQIIIDENGIEFCNEKIIYKWEKIDYAFIKEESAGKHIHYYFSVVTKDGEISKLIDDIKYSQEIVISTIEYFSGRDIGEISDKFRDEIIKIIGSKNNVRNIMNVFSKSRERQMIIGFIIFLSIVGISVYYQLNSDFTYCIGYGFVFAIIVLFLYGYFENKLLRENEQIFELSNEQFDTIAKKYQIKHSKMQMIGIIIFFLVIAVAIFVISSNFAK